MSIVTEIVASVSIAVWAAVTVQRGVALRRSAAGPDGLSALRTALAEPAGLWIRLSLIFIAFNVNLLLSGYLPDEGSWPVAGLSAAILIWEGSVRLRVVITRTRRTKIGAE
jgi:hypothetical protein